MELKAASEGKSSTTTHAKMHTQLVVQKMYVCTHIYIRKYLDAYQGKGLYVGKIGQEHSELGQKSPKLGSTACSGSQPNLGAPPCRHVQTNVWKCIQRGICL